MEQHSPTFLQVRPNPPDEVLLIFVGACRLAETCGARAAAEVQPGVLLRREVEEKPQICENRPSEKIGSIELIQLQVTKYMLWTQGPWMIYFSLDFLKWFKVFCCQIP